MCKATSLVTAVLFMLASAAAAEGDLPKAPVDDAIKLVKADLGKEVLLAWVDALPAYDKVESDEIVELKEAGVPESVIAAMIRKGGGRVTEESEREAARTEMEIIRRYEVPGVGSGKVDTGDLKIPSFYKKTKSIISYRLRRTVGWSVAVQSGKVHQHETCVHRPSGRSSAGPGARHGRGAQRGGGD